MLCVNVVDRPINTGLLIYLLNAESCCWHDGVSYIVLQVSCAVRSYWQQTPSILSNYKHSQQSYFVGLQVDPVSLLLLSHLRWIYIHKYVKLP